MTTATERCSAHIANPGGWGNNPCSRKGKVWDQEKWWCTQHSPAKKAERQQQSHDKYEVENKIFMEQQAIATYNRAAGDYCRALDLAIEDLDYRP